MKVLLGVISPAAAWNMPRRFADQLRRDFPGHTWLEAWDREAVGRLLPEADVAFTPVLDSEVFSQATRLKWIQVPAVGVDHLLYPAMVAGPVAITNARGIRARAMAEHVLGVTIALARQFHTAMRHQVTRVWAQDLLEPRGSTAVRTLQGCRLGIVGLGAIGVEIARLAAAFGLRVSAIRRRAHLAGSDFVEEILPPERLDDLLARSDVVVLAAPVTPATRQLIGTRALGAIKRGAFLINIGRGALVDDAALVDALRRGHLGGAALDVFASEPLEPSSPYWDLPNVIVTPHTSGAMEDYWTPLVALFSENLQRFEAGRPLLNLVDKHAGY